MVCVGRDMKDHLFPSPVPWAGTQSSQKFLLRNFPKPGFSKPHPTWLRKIPGMEHHDYSGQPIPVPHHPYSKEFHPNI